MTHIVPEYYTEFQCIAGKCRHSCCIGWEIDIDSETLEYYKTIKGDLGKRLGENIVTNGDTASFALDKDERCPFLNSDGLCDLILGLGEESLCRICTEHPRFHNTCAQCDNCARTESGLGLCCEAAAELIINRNEKVRLISLSDDGEEMSDEEAAFYEMRDSIIETAQDRTLTVDERMAEILAGFNASMPEKMFEEWAAIYLSLERLDPKWDTVLADVAGTQPYINVPEIQYEQLLVYFLYRHLSASVDDGDFMARCAFCILSAKMIKQLSERGVLPLIEAARMYSSEVEYSEDNTDTLLDILFYEINIME